MALYSNDGCSPSPGNHEPGKTDKTTMYLFGTYEDGALQFLPHEEGRIRPTTDASNPFVYDYMLKDHLGNVRMVLTEEQKADPYPTLTFEAQDKELQNAAWDNKQGDPIDVDNVGAEINGPYDLPNNSNFMLTRKDLGPIAAAKLLKVMAGDRIHTSLEYYYYGVVDNTPTNSGLNAVVTGVITSLTGNASTLLAGSETSFGQQLTDNSGLGDFLDAITPNTTTYYPYEEAPKAYLCVLFFDERFQFDANHSYVKKVENITDFTSTGMLDATFSNAIEVPKNGYAYVFFTNESNTSVYIDNFTLSHERGRILEETHYYPFGLTMAGISSKALDFGGAVNKRNKFQNQEFVDNFGVDGYEFKYRVDDPQIG